MLVFETASWLIAQMEKKSIVKEKAVNFALEIIDLYRFLQKKKEYVLSNQLLKSGTSIGANI